MVRRKKASSPFGDLNLGKSPLFTKTHAQPTRDSRRSFTATQKKEILYQQDNKCASSICHHKKLDPRATHFHHEKPWGSGGRTIIANGKALCADCHEIVSHRQRVKDVDKKRPKRNSSPFSNLL